MAKTPNRMSHMVGKQPTPIESAPSGLTKKGKVDRRRKDPDDPVRSVSVALRSSELDLLDNIALELNGGDPQGNVTRSGVMTWACREFLRRWERKEIKPGDLIKRTVSLTEPR